MRKISIFIITVLFLISSVAFAQACSLKNYALAEDGSFQLPQNCTGNVSVNFDSENDLKKLKALDNSAYLQLRKILVQLAKRKTFVSFNI